jgi:hypothetical protein
MMGHTGSYEYFGEMVDAKPDESFNDVFDRLGEMICVCTQMTEDHLCADGTESKAVGEEKPGSGGFSFQ